MSVELRTVGRADLGAAVELHNRVVPADAYTAREVEGYLDAVDAHLHLLALLDGRAAGVGLVTLEAGDRERGRGHVVLAVAPESRGHGLGSSLLASLSAWSRDEGLRELEGWVEEADAGSLAWAQRRGFREAGRESRLVLELAGLDPPDPAPPEGVELATLGERPELVRGVYEVVREAYPDIPGEEAEEASPFDDWRREDLEGPSDRPEAVFVALADGEVVGYSKFHLPEARPAVAAHDLTGVKRAWRGRGIAGALKRRQIAWALEAGYERLVTMNEVRNEPIRRLNERLGYRPAPGRVLVRGALFHSPGNGLQSD